MLSGAPGTGRRKGSSCGAGQGVEGNEGGSTGLLTLLDLRPKHLCVLQVDDDDIDIYMKEKKDEEEELREAMEAGKESTVFARVKVPTQVS